MQTAAVPGDAASSAPARVNRFAISLGLGAGSVALGDLDAVGRAFAAQLAGSGVTVEPPSSGLAIHATLSLRYYTPYYFFAELGYSTLYNWASSAFDFGGASGELNSYSLLMEVPLLVGGYYPVHERITVYGGLGPSYIFFARSYWDINPGDAPDFKADGGIGLRAVAGADFFVGKGAAFSLELGFRYASASPMRDDDSGITITPSTLPGLMADGELALDYTGVSATLFFRIFVL